jgi:hypothetical protein
MNSHFYVTGKAFLTNSWKRLYQTVRKSIPVQINYLSYWPNSGRTTKLPHYPSTTASKGKNNSVNNTNQTWRLLCPDPLLSHSMPFSWAHLATGPCPPGLSLVLCRVGLAATSTRSTEYIFKQLEQHDGGLDTRPPGDHSVAEWALCTLIAFLVNVLWALSEMGRRCRCDLTLGHRWRRAGGLMCQRRHRGGMTMSPLLSPTLLYPGI